MQCVWILLWMLRKEGNTLAQVLMAEGLPARGITIFPFTWYCKNHDICWLQIIGHCLTKPWILHFSGIAIGFHWGNNILSIRNVLKLKFGLSYLTHDIYHFEKLIFGPWAISFTSRLNYFKIHLFKGISSRDYCHEWYDGNTYFKVLKAYSTDSPSQTFGLAAPNNLSSQSTFNSICENFFFLKVKKLCVNNKKKNGGMVC